jgi:hypothetical protein
MAVYHDNRDVFRGKGRGMRTIGHRKERPVGISASGELLAEGARFNDEIHRLPTGNTTFIPKGVYRFLTHAEANQHQLDCLVKGMAQIAKERANAGVL